METKRWHKYDIGAHVTVQESEHTLSDRPARWQGTIQRAEVIWSGVGYSIAPDSPNSIPLFVHERNVVTVSE